MKRGLTLILALALILGLWIPAAAAGSAAGAEALDRAVRAVRDWEAEVDLSDLDLSKEEAMEALKGIREDPELFYFQNFTLWSTDEKALRAELKYREEFTREDTAVFDAAVREALTCVLPGMTDLEKALVLHDYLALQTAYDEEAYRSGNISSASYTAYGALVLGKAVCQGYSMAYRVLLERCGISTEYAASDRMGHGWTLVQLGENWYHVDVTWDDPVPDRPGRVGHTYFLLSDQAIGDREHRHVDWETMYACTDTSYDSGMYWQNREQPLWFTDADTCWMLQVSGKGREQRIDLLRRDRSTGQTVIAHTFLDYWKVWGSGSSYWTEAYSGLALWKGRLYFNDTRHIYAYDPEDGTVETVFTYEGGEGDIYGLCPAEEGLLWVLNTDPRLEGVPHLFTPAGTSAPAEGGSEGPFADVAPEAYYADAVLWALEKNVTRGVSETRFAPQDTCTRAQVVTFLYRAMGEPAPGEENNPFGDVAETAYYRNAVLWAVEKGITNDTGTDPETGRAVFSPDAKCTYAHILTFLWRAVTGKQDSGYGEWYDEPLDWARFQGLLPDTLPGTDPDRVKENCPRCDAVTYLWRALKDAG